MQMSGLATGGPTSSLEISSSIAYTARVSLFYSKPRLQNTLNNSRDVSLMGPRPCLECLYPPCFLLLSEMIRNCILFERGSTGQPLGIAFWAGESVWELYLNEHRPVVSGWISENSIGTCGPREILLIACVDGWSRDEFPRQELSRFIMLWWWRGRLGSFLENGEFRSRKKSRCCQSMQLLKNAEIVLD